MVVRSTVLSFLSSSIADILIIESGSHRRITCYRERIRSCLRDHLRAISLCIWKSVTILLQLWQAGELVGTSAIRATQFPGCKDK